MAAGDGGLERESEVVIDPAFEDGLVGIDAYPHLIIVYHLHRARRYDLLHTVHGMEERPTGVFACRCPWRPNAIGVTVVELVGRLDNRLRVRGLDAIDGSPVLDVKPYLPQRDAVRPAAEPWLPHAPEHVKRAHAMR